MGHRSRMKRHGSYGETPLRSATPPGLTAWGVVEHNGWTEIERVDGLGSCWEYDGPRFNNGYGQVKSLIDAPNPRLAHRVSYAHHKGDIPQDMVVRHRCDNPPCMNPAHLILGTMAENAQDRATRWRSAHGERGGNAKLSDMQATRIREVVAAVPSRIERGPVLRALAEELGVHYATVQSVWLRQTFRHLPGGYRWTA